MDRTVPSTTSPTRRLHQALAQDRWSPWGGDGRDFEQPTIVLAADAE